MKTTKQVTRKARRLFRLCLINESLDEALARQVVQGVLQAQRRGSHILLSRFLHLLKLDRSRHTAEVESATALPADLRQSVQAALARMYGASVKIGFAQRPALIGGMRIKVGSDVYDGSVKARLADLEHRF